jgi:hypothetical protein
MATNSNLAPPFVKNDPRRSTEDKSVQQLERFRAMAAADPEGARKLLESVAKK